MTDPASLGSVSQHLGGLRAGDAEAVRQLWARYFQPLVRLARGRLLAHGCLERDAEDVALEAFWNLCVEAARLPNLRHRAHLWKLLACFTAREACDVARKELRRRRLVGEVAHDLAAFAGSEPPAEFAVAVADLLESLPSEELRRIALARAEGWTNEEIAQRHGRSVSTIERKLQVIRALWAVVAGDA